jgi:organic radical activating enzyme
MLCGGEPMVVPHFMEIAESLGSRGVDLKIETNGQRLEAATARRLAVLPVRSVQVSSMATRRACMRASVRRVAREGARGVSRDPRRRACTRDHLRAHANQHR